MNCYKCGKKLRHYDYVKRIVRTKLGKKYWIIIPREYCKKCGITRRVLPDYLTPYKHYERNIIEGVVDGTITNTDLDYEDYPCEVTMQRWVSAHKKHLLL